MEDGATIARYREWRERPGIPSPDRGGLFDTTKPAVGPGGLLGPDLDRRGLIAV